MACWGSNRSDSRGRSPRAIKLQVFLLGTPFSYFFGTFCKFLATSAKNSFFSSFLPLSRQTNDKFGNNLKIFKASPHYLGKKLVEFDLDLLEITQNWQKWRDFTSFFLPSFIAIYRFNANFKSFLFDLVSHHLVFISFILFVCLLSWTHTWHFFLKSPCIRTIQNLTSFLRRHRILQEIQGFCCLVKQCNIILWIDSFL